MKIILLVLISLTSFAQEVVFTARPIEINLFDNLPSDLPMELKGMNQGAKLKITYLVEGKGLVNIDNDSLVVEYAKDKNGQDYSKKRTGESEFKLGSFPKASDDGKYLVFELSADINQFSSLGDLNIKASLNAVTSDKSIPAEAKLNMDEKTPVKSGEFSFINSANKVSTDLFGSMSQADQTNINVSGPTDSIIYVKVYDGTTELSSNGSTSTNNSSTYYFPKTSNKNLTIKFSYWQDLKKAKVIIDTKPAQKPV